MTMKANAGFCLGIMISVLCCTNMSYFSFNSNAATVTRELDRRVKSSNNIRTSEHAFFTLLAGIDPSDTAPLHRDKSYLGYLLHLAAVRYMLDETGSQMDVVVLVRMAKGTNHTTLPRSQETYLSKLRMRVEYLPPGKVDSFNSFMMEKFHILRFTEYKRALFFDADVLPLCNWDHYVKVTMTHENEKSIFAPNLIFAFRSEPAQGGFFVMEPERGALEEIREIHYINTSMGFGTPLQYPAEGAKVLYRDWAWHGSSVDQGMIYHWLRYVKKDVTIFNRNRVQRWSWNGSATTLCEIRDFEFTCPNHVRIVGEGPYGSFLVTRDIIHFTGRDKPWMSMKWSDPVIDLERTEGTRYQIWSHALRMAWKNYDLGLARDLFPDASNSTYQDVEMVDGFLSRKASSRL